MKPGGVVLASVLVCLGAGSSPAFGQTLSERIDAVRAQRTAAAATEPVPVGPSVERLLASTVSLRLEGQSFDAALAAWSDRSGIKLLINRPAWDRLGVDLALPVTLELNEVPASRALLVLLDVGSPDFEFVAEPFASSAPTLELQTKQEANRKSIVRVYDVRDLVMEIPSFVGAPTMNLDAALEQGGGQDGGGGGGDIFETDDETDEPVSLQERGDALADTIRQSVEPDLWRANGGDAASVRFRNGQLVVRAPAYVHARIGGTTLSGGVGAAGSVPVASASSTAAPVDPGPAAGDDGVAGVSSNAPTDVAGVAD